MDLHGISAHLGNPAGTRQSHPGHDVERIAVKPITTPVREDLYLNASGMTIKKGEVACREHTWTGYVDGRPTL